MQDDDWGSHHGKALGMLIDGAATDEVDDRGHAVMGDTLLILVNTSDEPISFTLPVLGGENIWVIMVDTARDGTPVVRSRNVVLEAHTLMLLRFGTDRRISQDEEPRREPLTLPEQHTL
jgi:glycogen operon protein